MVLDWTGQTIVHNLSLVMHLFPTRAGLIVDCCYVVTLAAPFICVHAIRLAKQGKLDAHKQLQTRLLIVCVAAVLALEGRIRVGGGSGSLTVGSPYAGTSLFHWVAGIHISVAVLTYLCWIWLLLKSRKSYQSVLPGPFSRVHKRLGWAVLLGLAFTSFSASVVYYLAFVA